MRNGLIICMAEVFSSYVSCIDDIQIDELDPGGNIHMYVGNTTTHLPSYLSFNCTSLNQVLRFYWNGNPHSTRCHFQDNMPVSSSTKR